MAKSNQLETNGKAGTDRPAKPYPDFPLFPHATGRWAKKIRGRLLYYGKWRGVPDDGWQAALELYQKHRDDDHAGRTRRSDGADGLNLRDLANRFLTDKQRLVDSGDIAPRTFRDYYDVCERTIKFFGVAKRIDDITAEDFSSFRADISKTRGPVALSNDIGRVRILFKWGYDSGLIDKPIRYGQGFTKPSRSVLRKSREAKGERKFTAGEIRRMIDGAENGVRGDDGEEWLMRPSRQLKAMVLLGINAGLGNNDCALLPFSALDLTNGWLNYPRPKTGIKRRCPLWPETIKAVKAAIESRPEAKDAAHAKLVFITSRLRSWAKDKDDNPITKETVKLLKALKIHRDGLSFYALRHTFQTIGEQSLDLPAVQSMMGHAPSAQDMSATYREGMIGDNRLRAVASGIHDWLFGTEQKSRKNASKSRAARAARRSAPKGRRRPAKSRAKSPA